jgi:hypothetical protein
MTISVKAQKMLWGRAAGRCSRPECREYLYEDETEADEATLVGENCHIVAESDDGPRASPSMPVGQRNGYSNLILLCRKHHKVIDAQEHTYSVEVLHQMKRVHEAWVKQQLGFDEAKQFDDEQYAGIVDEWQRLAHVAEWRAWASWALSNGQPKMSAELDRDLSELRGWLLSRVWPDRYPELRDAFENFRRVLSDFQERFREHADETRGGGSFTTRRFYKIDEYNEERYSRLLKEFEFHVDLVEDLMLELTRAANLVADRIRQHLIRGYGLKTGRLVVEYGPLLDFSYRTVVVQYSSEERKEKLPYPGLAQFLARRAERDHSFGKGSEP